MPHKQTSLPNWDYGPGGPGLTPMSAQHFDPREHRRRARKAYEERDERVKSLLTRLGRNIGKGAGSAYKALTTPYQWGRDKSGKDPYGVGAEGEFANPPGTPSARGGSTAKDMMQIWKGPSEYGAGLGADPAQFDREIQDAMLTHPAPPMRQEDYGRGIGASPEMAYNRPGAAVAPGPRYAPPVATPALGAVQPAAMATTQPMMDSGVPAAAKALKDAQATIANPKASDKKKRNAMALMRGGLAMMTAASRPGATGLGALGQGATVGLDYLAEAKKGDVAAAEKARKEKIETAELGLKVATARSLDSYRKALVRAKRRKSGGVNKLRADAIKAAVKGAFESDEFGIDERSTTEKLTANLKAIGEMPEKLPSDKSDLKAGEFYKDSEGNVAYFDGRRFSPLPWDEVGEDGANDEADLGGERDLGL